MKWLNTESKLNSFIIVTSVTDWILRISCYVLIGSDHLLISYRDSQTDSQIEIKSIFFLDGLALHSPSSNAIIIIIIITIIIIIWVPPVPLVLPLAFQK